jgi:hypothetical protein
VSEAEAIAMVLPALLRGDAALLHHQGNPLRLVGAIAAAMASHGCRGLLLVGQAARSTADALAALQGPLVLVGATDGHARKGAWADPPEKVLGLQPGHPPIGLVVMLAAHAAPPRTAAAIAGAARAIGAGCLVLGDPGALPLSLELVGRDTGASHPPATITTRAAITPKPPTNGLEGWVAQIRSEQRISRWPTVTKDHSLVVHHSEGSWWDSILRSGLGSECQVLVWRHRDADRITSILRSGLPCGDAWQFGERIRLFGAARVAVAGEVVIAAASPTKVFSYSNQVAGVPLELNALVQELQLQPATGGQPITLLVEPPGHRQVELELKRLKQATKGSFRGDVAGLVFNELSRLAAQAQRAHPTSISTIASVAGIGHWDCVWLDARDLDNAPAKLQAALVSAVAGCCNQLNLLAVTGGIRRPPSMTTS